MGGTASCFSPPDTLARVSALGIDFDAASSRKHKLYPAPERASGDFQIANSAPEGTQPVEPKFENSERTFCSIPTPFLETSATKCTELHHIGEEADEPISPGSLLQELSTRSATLPESYLRSDVLIDVCSSLAIDATCTVRSLILALRQLGVVFQELF